MSKKTYLSIMTLGFLTSVIGSDAKPGIMTITDGKTFHEFQPKQETSLGFSGEISTIHFKKMSSSYGDSSFYSLNESLTVTFEDCHEPILIHIDSGLLTSFVFDNCSNNFWKSKIKFSFDGPLSSTYSSSGVLISKENSILEMIYQNCANLPESDWFFNFLSHWHGQSLNLTIPFLSEKTENILKTWKNNQSKVIINNKDF